MILPNPRDNQFLFLDMNSFFASCEQHRRADLRGKPVAVTPTLAASGCIIAASYEAKQQGVKTGWRVGEAKKQIPGLIVLEANPKYYVTIHEQIATFLIQEITPTPLKLSVDEFAIPLDKTEQWTPNAHRLALFIKQRLETIFSPVLRCSIGIGPNIFLAKLGTELHKPNGLTVLQLHRLHHAYQQLRLRDIPGINWGMAYQLQSLGITSPLAFFGAERQFLHNAFGLTGDAWWYNLHGYRVDVQTKPTQSISHSHVLAPDKRTQTKAQPIIHKLILKVTERLRDKQLATQSVCISVRQHSSQPSHRPKKWFWEGSLQATQDPFVIARAFATAYEQAAIMAPLKVTVVATHLVPHNPNPTLFDATLKSAHLLQAMDTINNRFGRWTLEPASLLSVHGAAPNRITFRVPDFPMD